MVACSQLIKKQTFQELLLADYGINIKHL